MTATMTCTPTPTPTPTPPIPGVIFTDDQIREDEKIFVYQAIEWVENYLGSRGVTLNSGIGINKGLVMEIMSGTGYYGGQAFPWETPGRNQLIGPVYLSPLPKRPIMIHELGHFVNWYAGQVLGREHFSDVRIGNTNTYEVSPDWVQEWEHDESGRWVYSRKGGLRSNYLTNGGVNESGQFIC